MFRRLPAFIAVASFGLVACNAIFGIEPPEGTTVGGASVPFGWARSNRGTGSLAVHGLAVAPNGAIIAGGTFSGLDVGFTTYPLPNWAGDTKSHPFVAAFSPSGEALYNTSWKALTMADNGSGATSAVTVAPSGNVYATGHIEGSTDFDGTPQTSTAGSDPFLLQLDQQGNLQWAMAFHDTGGTSGDQMGVAVAADSIDCDGMPGESVVWLGMGEGAIDVGDIAGMAGSPWLYVLRVNSNQGGCWFQAFKGSQLDPPTKGFAGPLADTPNKLAFLGGLALGPQHEIWIATTFQGQSNLVDATMSNLVSAGGSDIAVVKLDAQGNPLWAERFGGVEADPMNGNQWATSITVGPDGDAFITGGFQRSLLLGTTTLQTASPDDEMDVFVARLARDTGNVVWAKAFGDAGAQQGLSIASDAAGHVTLLGYAADTQTSHGIDFGFGPLVGHNGAGSEGLLAEDILVAKFDGAGSPLWSRRYGDTHSQIGFGVAADASGRLAIGGRYQGSVVFDPTAPNAAVTTATDNAGFVTVIGP